MLVSGSVYFNMDVSENSGTPKSSMKIGFSIIKFYKPSILGCPYFWKHPYWIYCMVKYDFINLETMHFLQQHNWNLKSLFLRETFLQKGPSH